MNVLQKSWNNIPKEISSKYLDGAGSPSIGSRELLIEIINKTAQIYGNKIIDIGCGNGNLCKYLQEKMINVDYTGVDFSENLLEAAKASYPTNNFILNDVIDLSSMSEKYNIAIYSHVLEILSSPEESLFHASQLADIIIIRFFEPPIHKFDSVEVLKLNLADGESPYIRRKISKKYYQLMLHNIKAKEVHIHEHVKSNDQVHVIFF
jgi:SAM-dependent methyltransferase